MVQVSRAPTYYLSPFFWMQRTSNTHELLIHMISNIEWELTMNGKDFHKPLFGFKPLAMSLLRKLSIRSLISTTTTYFRLGPHREST